MRNRLRTMACAALALSLAWYASTALPRSTLNVGRNAHGGAVHALAKKVTAPHYIMPAKSDDPALYGNVEWVAVADLGTKGCSSVVKNCVAINQ